MKDRCDARLAWAACILHLSSFIPPLFPGPRRRAILSLAFQARSALNKRSPAMWRITRRRFVGGSVGTVASVATGSAALRGLPAVQAGSPGNKVVLAIVGAGGRGMDVILKMLQFSDVSIKFVCDPEEARGQGAVRAAREDPAFRAGLRGRHAQGAGRQGRAGRRGRHAGAVARPGDDLGLPGGQGRLRGEEHLAARLGRAQDDRGRPEVQADRPGRLPEPQRALRLLRPRVHRRTAAWGRSST